MARVPHHTKVPHSYDVATTHNCTLCQQSVLLGRHLAMFCWCFVCNTYQACAGQPQPVGSVRAKHCCACCYVMSVLLLAASVHNCGMASASRAARLLCRWCIIKHHMAKTSGRLCSSPAHVSHHVVCFQLWHSVCQAGLCEVVSKYV
jgi:hypothetical protein